MLRVWCRTLIWTVAIVALPVPAPQLATTMAQPTDKAPEDPRLADPEGAFPKTHFKVRDPANLSDAEAAEIYETVARQLHAAYSLSKHPAAASYQRWRRYNTAPYRATDHGERYLNNYANPQARAYGLYERVGELPAGSVIAKDSFAVTQSGRVFAGPLFLMEKMPAGFDPPGGDWRYTMIMPDGGIWGVTKGENSANMDFCAECHAKAGPAQDFLFFLPERLRVQPESEAR